MRDSEFTAGETRDDSQSESPNLPLPPEAAGGAAERSSASMAGESSGEPNGQPEATSEAESSGGEFIVQIVSRKCGEFIRNLEGTFSQDQAEFYAYAFNAGSKTCQAIVTPLSDAIPEEELNRFKQLEMEIVRRGAVVGFFKLKDPRSDFIKRFNTAMASADAAVYARMPVRETKGGVEL